METIIVKVKSGNVEFLISLLKKLNIVSEIKTKKSSKNKKKILPVRLPKGKPQISDFAGIWSENPKTLDQIREKGWIRN